VSVATRSAGDVIAFFVDVRRERARAAAAIAAEVAAGRLRPDQINEKIEEHGGWPLE